METRQNLDLHCNEELLETLDQLDEYFEKELLYLDRIEFAGIKKRDLQRGKWRFLDHKELGFLKMVKAK